MQRREILKLFAAAATGCLAGQRPGRAWLQRSAMASSGGRGSSSLSTAAQSGPLPASLLPLFPLRLVLFPGTNLPLHIFEPRYKEMIADCLQNNWEFGILLVQDESLEKTGCTASITEVIRKYSDGRMDILVRGQRRFEVTSLDEEKSYLRGTPRYFEDAGKESGEDDAAAGSIPAVEKKLREETLRLFSRLQEMLKLGDPSVKEQWPAASEKQLSFQLMAHFPAELDWKQDLLELRSERERLEFVTEYFRQVIQFLESAPGQPLPLPTGTA